MDITKINSNLYLIDLKQSIRGFRDFIGSWLFVGDCNFLVDVGPASTVKELVESLKNLGVQRLDYVFLTHIHLDHAGGIGEFVKFFPEAKVICHKRAVEHLVTPEKLWQATKKVLGEVAIAYGEMKPLSEEKIILSSEFELEGFQALNTPGHAVHHVSYVWNKYLFAGEVGGVFHCLGDKTYLRPATPPRFFLEVAVESLDKLQNLSKKEICFGHFGIHKDSKEILERHRNQLFLWKDVVADQMKRTSDKEDLVENCISELLLIDESFMSFNLLDDDIRERERYFIKNTIDGYIGYLLRVKN